MVKLKSRQRQALIIASLVALVFLTLIITLWDWNTYNHDVGIALFEGNLPPVPEYPERARDDEAVILLNPGDGYPEIAFVTTRIYIPGDEGSFTSATPSAQTLEWDSAWDDRGKWPESSAGWSGTVSTGRFALQTS